MLLLVSVIACYLTIMVILAILLFYFERTVCNDSCEAKMLPAILVYHCEVVGWLVGFSKVSYSFPEN